MIKKINLLFVQLCVFMCITHTAFAKTSFIAANHSTAALINVNPKDSTVVKVAKVAASNLAVKTFRDFESLKTYDELPKRLQKASLKAVEEGFKFKTEDSLVNKEWLQKANNTFATIDETLNYVDELSEDVLAELPVAIRPKKINNVMYTVGVAKAVFKPAYTELTLFLKIDTSKGTLILGAKDVKLSHEGGIVGEAKLSLISQFTLNFDKGKVIATLKGSFENPETYALIDCRGFKELGISADILFSQGLIHPVDAQGKAIGGYVSSSFKTVVSDWNDIVVNISLPEFGVKGLKGTTFRLNTAVLDFSDLRNDSALPSAYLSKYYSEQPELWRGVYIKTLEVILPREFKKKNQDQRITFGASNLIIDSQGITGQFYAENLISIDEGSASKWQFSLDRFSVDIEVSTLKEAEFNGQVLLPVAEKDRLDYQALIQPDEYTLSVRPTDSLDFDVWNANVVLKRESFIELKVKDGKFLPKANLTGRINIASGLGKDGNASKTKNTVDFKGIKFQNLLLQTESPKLSVDYFGYKGNQKLANFPVVINEIGLEAPLGGNYVNLIFDFNINLSSESDGANGAGAKLVIEGQFEEQNGRDRFQFKGIDLERISIAMDVAGTQLKGAIFIFEDDPTYGTGFAGAVGAKFKTGFKLEVEAKALFGRTADFRYWFADAQAVSPVGIPIFAGFSLNTFGGGIYNHMKMVGVNSKGVNNAHNSIGASSSGVIYAPDGASGMGMKAMVGITTINSQDLFHASLEFGMTYRRLGGLRDIYFKGRGELVSVIPADFSSIVLGKLNEIIDDDVLTLPNPPPAGGAISADVFIGYDFVNDIFQATSELYVNYGIIKGVGAQGRAGWLDFYSAPNDWHILVGTPNDPIGMEINIGIIKKKTKSYFMTGKNIPGSPPPPPIVAKILGLEANALDYTRDLNSLESGNGMAFGSHISVDTGDLSFLIFYARFQAGMGFDIMLKDYGDAYCKGSTEQIGLNGWYANGQAYAYLQGELGLRFKLFGSRKKIPIIRGGAAVLVQARLPNPVWVRGYVGGHYNLLGGLIKGKFRFKLELGEKCEIVGGSPIDGIVVIGSMTPKTDSDDVDVFAAPQVVFNMPLNKVFEIPDDTGDRKYKIILDKFEVTQNAQAITGKIEWNTTNDVAVFYSHEILPPNKKIKVHVQLHFEEYINNRWEIIKEDGKVSLETKEIVFTTGEAPTTIPLQNIEYMYPVVDQQNFYREEYNTGYVKLKRGQNYLFEAAPDWTKMIRFTSEQGTAIEKTFVYNVGAKQLTFNIPENLEGETSYTSTINLVPKATSIDANVTQKATTTQLGNSDENTLTVTQKEATETKIAENERKLLEFVFRTSLFKTFDKKMKAMKESDVLYRRITFPYGLTLVSKIEYLEAFDLLELKGNGQTRNKPLIQARAVLDDSYFTNIIKPLLYQNYPLNGGITVTRNTDEVGVPPIEAVQPVSWYLTYLENGHTADINEYNPYRYNLTDYYHQDYEDLRYQLINSENYVNGGGALVTEPFPYMRKGKYKTELKYVLPGQTHPNTTHRYRYTNPLNDNNED